MTTHPGIHTDSARNPNGFTPDSALSQPASQRRDNPTTSRTDAQTHGRAIEEALTSRIRRIPQADALTRLIADLRPDWPIDDIHTWALRDPRPWNDVVAAGINGARDRTIRQVGGLQFAGPAAPTQTQTYPTVHEALNPQLCKHDFRIGACPHCRRHPQGEPR